MSRSRARNVDAQAVQGAALRLFAQRGYRATTMADIGAELGIRGPSIYRYINSKQDLLANIMVDTMETLISGQSAARLVGGSLSLQLQRMVEAHVRYHASHREQAFVGNRELNNLVEPHKDHVLALRRKYEGGVREVIESGVQSDEFATRSTRLASYAILDMGMGVAAWFRSDGPHTVDEVAYAHAEFALRMLGDADRISSNGSKLTGLLVNDSTIRPKPKAIRS